MSEMLSLAALQHERIDYCGANDNRNDGSAYSAPTSSYPTCLYLNINSVPEEGAAVPPPPHTHPL